MRKLTMSKKWLIPLALLLVMAGVTLGLGVQRLASESAPKPGTVQRRIVAPLAELQNLAPFTLYAPAELPASFVELSSVLETTESGAGPSTEVQTRYLERASGLVIILAQRDARISEDEFVRMGMERLQVGGKSVWLRRGETYGRPEKLGVHWHERDVYVFLGVSLEGRMTESDVWPIIASFAPVPPAPRPVLAPTSPVSPPPTPITPPAETPAASPPLTPAPATPGPQSTAAPAEPPTPMPYPPITPVSSGP